MGKRVTQTSPMNHLKLDTRLNLILMNIKDQAKRETGREFGTQASRGSGAYERALRETLDAGLEIIKKRKSIKGMDAEILSRRLIHDYNYGFKMREQERSAKEYHADTPVMDKSTIIKRMKEIEEKKAENVKRTSEKFMVFRAFARLKK